MKSESVSSLVFIIVLKIYSCFFFNLFKELNALLPSLWNSLLMPVLICLVLLSLFGGLFYLPNGRKVS